MTLEHLKHVVDASTIGWLVAIFMGILPNIGAVLTVVWLGVRLHNEVMVAVYRRREHKAKLAVGSDGETIKSELLDS